MAVLLPELAADKTSIIRIPDQIDVPVSARVRRIIDTPEFQRLRGISQLGLVANIYPGATHSRFEHSLGVYRLACQVLNRLLAVEQQFAAELTNEEAERFLLAALLHDVGHWPYCHPIEDLQFSWVPAHERFAHQLIGAGELARAINEDWETSTADVARFLAGSSGEGGSRSIAVLQNVMNGPIDIDKMDYLQRDSLHAGVPYGRNFDIARLVAALCIGEHGDSIAISDKGKTAAEMMVFARYVMFSEVYWHHAVRSGTAMLQRLVYEIREHVAPERWLTQSDQEFAVECLRLAPSCGKPVEHLAQALFGHRRLLFKRLAQYSCFEYPELHQALSQLPYPQLVEIANRFADGLRRDGVCEVQAGEVLIDAPPIKLEVQFKLSVRHRSRIAGRFEYIPLASISPVVNSLATQQFDSFVKRVRVFVAPDLAHAARIPEDEIANRLMAAVG